MTDPMEDVVVFAEGGGETWQERAIKLERYNRRLNDRLRKLEAVAEAAKTVRDLLDADRISYERNGPQWTSSGGNEYESTSDVLAVSDERADILREALAALAPPSTGGEA